MALALGVLLLVAASSAIVVHAQTGATDGAARPVVAGPGPGAPSMSSRNADGMPPGLAPVAAAVMAPTDYHLVPDAGTFTAANQAQGLASAFSAAGVRVQPAQSDAALNLSLQRVGRAGALAAPLPATVVAEGARAEYRRGSLTEWYVNDPKGVEQGFTLDAAPPGDRSQPVVVELAASGLRPVLDPSASTVRFESDGTTVTYGGLHAYDATGKPLSSRQGLDGTTVTLSVDDAGAVYPLTIDPIIATQQAHLFRGDPGDSNFGTSVAVDGNTAVVGALGDNGIGGNTGSAYVFVRSGSTWTVQAHLFASDGGDADLFGASVAISGNTVVVGAYFDDSPSSQEGSAYVFVRSGTTWTQQAKLVAPDASVADFFGFSVAVSGDTALVGAPGDDTVAGTDAGSAHVFVRTGTTWAPQAQLFGSMATQNDGFGVSVALVGETAAVGAPGNATGAASTVGSTYVFTRKINIWNEEARLTASDAALGDEFGYSVGLSGESAVVGARNDDDGAINAGSAYVFLRTGTTWAQQAKLVADDPGNGDQFGTSVGIAGDTVVVGSVADDTAAGTNAGSAYVYTRSGTTWAQQAHLFASDAAASDFYGNSVAISADTVIVGAPFGDNQAGTNAGSAYVYTLAAGAALTTTITTQAMANATLGQAISDTATVTGTGPAPTGTVVFTAYAPADTNCAAAIFTSAAEALAGGPPPTAASGPFTPTASGTYRWKATYSGDANYSGVNGACNDLNESSNVGKATPTITTQASPGGPVGAVVTDTATLTGGASPTGTVTFRLFSDSSCTSQVFTSTNAVPATSGTFTPAAPGTYYWIAVYSGDANNNGAPSPCGAPNESVTITKTTPTISTQASPGGLLGAPVRDVATLAGGSNPSGSVTFRLFSDANCGNQVFTSTNAVPATSDWFTPAAPGTYYWTAVYNGDANNSAATSPCGAPNESVTIAPFVAPAPTSTVTGDFLGPITVNAGQSVLITGARVVGPVTVNPGGALTVVDSQISRGVVVTNPSFLSICNTQVSGPSPSAALSVSNAAVPIRIGDPATGCAGNRFAGPVVLTANLAVTFGANTASANVTASNGGPGNTILKANNVFGTLGCSGNNPAPTNAGQPNTAGSKTGQCTGL
jgi:hypothetical protein